MKITAISTFLVAALAVSVSAAPKRPIAPDPPKPKPTKVEKDEPTERVVLGGDEKDARRDAPAADDDGWIELASPTPARHGRQYITVDGSAGPLTQLRIDAHDGRPLVRSVRIRYTDGKQQVVRVNKTLARGKSAFVDLRSGRELDHIIIETTRKPKASYTVHASTQRDAVATR